MLLGIFTLGLISHLREKNDFVEVKI